MFTNSKPLMTWQSSGVSVIPNGTILYLVLPSRPAHMDVHRNCSLAQQANKPSWNVLSSKSAHEVDSVQQQACMQGSGQSSMHLEYMHQLCRAA